SATGRAHMRCFGPAARRQLQNLLPHLRRATRIYLRRAALDSERQAFGAALDRIPVGVILLDRPGHVCATNRVGDRLLSRRDGLFLDRSGLQAARAEDTSHLHELVAEIVTSGSSDTIGLLLARPSGRCPLAAALAALPAGGTAHNMRWAAGLFVVDPEETGEVSAALLHALYRLTPAESALAGELANGRSGGQAAQRLRITPGTARQRLGVVFSKTGTKRQSSLVRLLLRGPASLLPPD